MRLIPIYTRADARNFMSVVKPKDFTIEKFNFHTAPLIINRTVNILDLSSAISLIAIRLQKDEDSIIGDISLVSFYYIDRDNPVVIQKSILPSGVDNVFKHLDGDEWLIEYRDLNGIVIDGIVNRRSGTCFVRQLESSSNRFEVLGYELECERGIVDQCKSISVVGCSKLYLYLLKRNDDKKPDLYGIFESCIVAASNEEKAKLMHPGGCKDKWVQDPWCNPKAIVCTELGIANIDVKEGLVLASWLNGSITDKYYN